MVVTTKTTVASYAYDGGENPGTVSIRVPSDSIGVVVTVASDDGAWTWSQTLTDAEAEAVRGALVSHYGEGT